MTPLDINDHAAVRALMDLKAHVFQFPRVDEPDIDAAMKRYAQPGQRISVTHDQGRSVASFLSFDTTLSVPGGADVSADAISGVVVLPTHKRRGLLSRWLTADIEQARERGDVACGLYASATGIYGRFGFGISTSHATATLDARGTTFNEPPTGCMRVVTGAEALAALPGVARAAQLANAGSIQPPTHVWKGATQQLPGVSQADRQRWFAVHTDECDQPDGVIGYTLADTWDSGRGGSTVTLHTLYAATPTAERELWRYAASIDFTATVVCEMTSPDCALPWWVSDPRAVTFGPSWDGLWSRILDVPAALSARRYPVDAQVALQVHDAAGHTQGHYHLEVDASGEGVCTRRRTSTREPDLTLGIADLSSLWLAGGAGVPSLAALVHSGRVRLSDATTLPRLSALFGWPVPARSLTNF